jgi:signal transduction histidine kinase
LIALSIRSRLTVWYFCFFALAGLLLSVASWFLLQRSLDVLMLHELDERVEDLESFLAAHSTDTSLETLRTETMQEYRSKDEGKWLQVRDQGGNWIYYSSRSRVANDIPPLSQAPAAILPFKPAKGHYLLTYTREVQAYGHTYSVSTAISADRSVLILARFRRDLLLMVPGVLLAAGIVGHFLSRTALEPVASIVSEVRRINERNLSTRLPAIPTKDELSLLSETLNEMLERIDAAFRSVRLLTVNTSHELRTPLSLIRTRVEIALCFPRTADYFRSAFEEVQAETLRMTSLIDDLLSQARYEAGATQPELQPIEVTALMAKAAREWAPTAELISLDLKMGEAAGPAWVLAHPESLERVIRTLIENACHYTPSGGWVRLHVRESECEVVLSIEDNGVGIDEKDLPHIFQRFYRGQQPLNKVQTGSGLGLSLAKWIVDQHRGSIVVESTLGEGSCFRVVLPAHLAESSPLRYP